MNKNHYHAFIKKDIIAKIGHMKQSKYICQAPNGNLFLADILRPYYAINDSEIYWGVSEDYAITTTYDHITHPYEQLKKRITELLELNTNPPFIKTLQKILAKYELFINPQKKSQKELI